METRNWHAVGKRKEAVARVWMRPGNGTIEVNQRTIDQYFMRPTLNMIIMQPLKLTSRVDRYDIVVNVHGGGLTGQAGAVLHGISRVLLEAEPELRPALKKAGFLTRDAREVERKKYGRRKARRRFQFSKR